jgi:glutamine cyclotransferase
MIIRMKNRKSVILSAAIFLAIASFALVPSLAANAANNQTQSSPIPVYGYKIINVYPHDKTAYTEGLVYDGKTLYESTGLYGKSTLRQVDLKTGLVLKLYRLSDEVLVRD